MSTFSPSLRIELITTGDQAGVWGNTTNTNLGTLVESAIAGYTSVSILSASQALTAVNGAADQSRNQVIALTTTTAAAFSVYAPPVEKTYVIYNASPYAATIYNWDSSVYPGTLQPANSGAGLGVTIPAGKTMTIWSDGTDFALQNTHIIGTVVGSATSAESIVAINWTVLESGGFLYFQYGGVNKMRLDSSGNLVAVGNITAYGTL